MATTQADISKWFDDGVSRGIYSHMIVVCDEFDWEDFPVFVIRGEDPREFEKKYDEGDLTHTMEVYNLSMDKETQLNEYRARNY